MCPKPKDLATGIIRVILSKVASNDHPQYGNEKMSNNEKQDKRIFLLCGHIGKKVNELQWPQVQDPDIRFSFRDEARSMQD